MNKAINAFLRPHATGSRAVWRHRHTSYGPLRRPLPFESPAFLPKIQTAADFPETKKPYIGGDEREQDMMTRIQTTAHSRVTRDPRINLMGERVDRVWEDPILTPRNGLAR